MQRKEFVDPDDPEGKRSGCRALVFRMFFLFLTGTLTYNIVEPHSFLGVLLFLVAWVVVHIIIMTIVALAFSMLVSTINKS